MPGIWRSDARTAVKFQATAHLTSYSIHLLLFAITVLYPVVVLAAAEHPGFRTFAGVAYPFALFSLAPIVFFVIGQRQLHRSWWRELPRILSVALIGPGLMLNTVRAAAEIRLRPDPEFERTAKFGSASSDPDAAQGGASWMRKRYQIGFDRLVFAEIGLGLYCTATAWLAWQHENWAVLTYAVLFGVGLFAVACLTAAQSLALHRERRARDEQVRLEEAALVRFHERVPVPAT